MQGMSFRSAAADRKEKEYRMMIANLLQSLSSESQNRGKLVVRARASLFPSSPTLGNESLVHEVLPSYLRTGRSHDVAQNAQFFRMSEDAKAW